MIHAFAIAALLLAPAAAKPTKCIPKAAARDMMIVTMPHIVESLAERCKAHLPAGAFLTGRGGDYAARLQSEAAGRVETASAAIRALAGDSMPKLKNDAALVAVAGEMAGSLITQKIQASSCVEADAAIEALSPLPAENVGMVFASLFALASASDKKDGPMICPHG